MLRGLIVQMERIEPSLHLVLEHQLSVMWEECPQAKLIFTEETERLVNRLVEGIAEDVMVDNDQGKTVFMN